uniref:NADH-ubiquinone oxidoreductase chain 3 n=1 Tax=Leptocentrus albolineatus TaxID=2605028 RepID=A0A5B9T5A5_9HEMI|nr:NADH dehydrogenase subunit 3 [Leptocentrus albolineatus]QEG98463.1 NADH dehydrogenase subunit 3 [Leptocentrus albolineatus]
MLITIKFSILLALIIMIMMLTLMMISKKSIINLQSMSPFECGYNPMSKKRLPLSIHFFLIAIIFLIFDIEIVIILPTVSVMKFTLIKFLSITLFMFLFILLLGLYYEWYNGLLNWTN